jgi:hypothetical protein
MVALRRAGHSTPRHGPQSAIVNSHAHAYALIARRDKLHRAKIEVLEWLEGAVAELPLDDQFRVQLNHAIHPKFERARIWSVANLDSRG